MMTAKTVDLVVVGAGPAGLSAAAEVARKGGNSIIVDEGPVPGGRLREQIYHTPEHSKTGSGSWSIGIKKAERLVDEALSAGVTILNGYSVWGIFPGWYTGIMPVDPFNIPKQSPAGYYSKALILATGATQNAMIFPGWTLPGIITAGAAQRLINVNGVLPGRYPVMVGIDPINFSVTQIFTAAGITPRCVLIAPKHSFNPSPAAPSEAIVRLAHYAKFTPPTFLSKVSKIGKFLSRPAAVCYPRYGIKYDGVPIMLRKTILSANGTDSVKTITVADVDYKGNIQSGTEKHWSVDTVITAAGLSPLAELAQVAGCPLVNLPELGGWVPIHGSLLQTTLEGLFLAGSITGVEGAGVAEAQGRLSGFTCAHYLGLVKTSELETKLTELLRAVIEARKVSIPFLPGIDKGRHSMKQIWKSNQSYNGKNT